MLYEKLESADPSTGAGADYTVRAWLDEFARTLDGRFDDDPIVEATARQRIGRAYFNLGLPDASEPHLRRALELCDADPRSQLDVARVLTDLAQTLLPLFRLRNLHAGALVRIHSSDTEGALAFLREIIESPVAYGWSEIAGDSPFFITRGTSVF